VDWQSTGRHDGCFRILKQDPLMMGAEHEKKLQQERKSGYQVTPKEKKS